MKKEDIERLGKEQKEADTLLIEKEFLKRKICTQKRRKDIQRKSFFRKREGLKDISTTGNPILTKKT